MKMLTNLQHRLFRSLLLVGCCVLSLQFGWSQRMVSGTLTDAESNDPLIGANVVVKGTSTGTITDFDGRYSLEIPDDATTLVYSYTGYTPKEIEVAGQSVINVQLSSGTILDEVVVIGYGTQKRADITGAVARFEAERLEERPIARVDQALVGQLAGVRVQQTSGLPGAGFKVQIRGTGSINANNQPLYVIDGFPLEVSEQNANGGFGAGNPLDNLNPNDIQSIEVLKDAAAAAIYGSRASNGVVLITTKSGQAGKARINLNVSYGFNETAKKLDILNAEEWIDRASEMIDNAWVNSGAGRTADQTSAERLQILGGAFNRGLIKDDRWSQPGHPGLVFIDWQDEMFRRGSMQNYQLSASGGNEYVKYYVSGDYLDSEGIAIGVGYKQYSARANVEVNASDRLTLGINLSPSYSIASDPGVEGKDQQMHIAVGMVPISEDTVGLDVNVGNNTPYTWGSSRSSPIRVIENTIGDRKIFRTLGTVYAQYNLLDGLDFRTSFNLDHADQTNKDYTPAWVTRNRTAGGRYSGYRRQTFVNENTLSFSKTLGGLHNLSAVIGTSYNTSKFDNYDIRVAGGFNSEVITTLNAANINAGGTYTRETKNTLISYFGRLQYNFNDRYLLAASLRRDGSSRFGPDTKWGVFPSVSAGWRVSEEAFMENVDLISSLKVRASWGISGNNGIGDYSHVSLLNFANYTFGGNLAPGQVPGNFANRSLGWEESETIDIGLDVGLFENRVFASFDYYTKRNTDLLLNIPVPTAIGFSSALTNIGEVLNKGWEVELSTRNLTGELGWNTSINFSHNSNEVVQLGPENTPILGGAFDITHNILMVGEPMYSIFVVQQDGILSQSDIDGGAALYGNQQEGDPKYVDANGDGVISPDDRVLSGHPNPDYVWGITNTFSYKGFDLSFLFQGQWGGVIYSTFGRAMDRTGQGFTDNTLGFHRDRWRSPDNPGAGERGKASSSFGRIKNTDWLYPNDYWRLRNLTLGYNLQNVLNSNLVSNARIYLTAENYFGGDKYLGGFNPEAVNNSGDDYGAFPLPKSIIFGLNLTF
ncbi:SusC/RagA family TonB-linked outer membrane protein [Flavilitoribacter nigricans]|uniref:SusC/RagA family TonB-linked outer membrane protein n=1 Tax=Flavilitoribacter nigricans (strain ATCC 23147 / DSM 23189 / NBRC 102662 / NCIMB 1420 / SS-2) TaxID=1122177 RepID=A0A2D0N3Z0_FLAN2|nr:TonB-dependent receptor [Flavilitoribacter nigricans]PHN03224.1 SusC/RagA family TonB-linked outer membrane protein [Flavilitoribacter nigricans DSM 23189 = NBRC 102662]